MDKPTPARAALSGLMLVIVTLATLVDQFGKGVPLAGHAANAAMLLYVALEYRNSPRAAKIIVWIAVLFAALLLPRAREPWLLLQKGVAFGAFLSAFFAALGFIRAASEKSGRIERAGRQLLAQPAGRRYLALTLGSNLFGLILSMGVVNLFGVMVKRGNPTESGAEGGKLRALRERRAMMAIQRGFSMVPTWSPLSIPIPIVLQAIPTLRWETLVPAALAGALLLLLAGWVDDKLAFSGLESTRATDGSGGGSGGWMVHAPFVLLVLGIFLASVLLEKTVGSSMVVGMMTCAPLAALLWMAGQASGLGWKKGAASLSQRLNRQVTEVFPQYRTEMIIMFMAGFFGVLVRETLPPGAIQEGIRFLAISPRWLPTITYLLVIVLSNLALHPMLAVIILSSAMPNPVQMGISPLSMALAYLCGWGVGISASPYTICNLMIGQLTGKTAHYVAYRWNGRYLLGVTLLGSVVLYLLA